MFIDYMKKFAIDSISVKIEAPVRVMDFGGWTDTWFSQYGKVLCLSVLSRNVLDKSADYYGIEAEAKVSFISKKGGFKLAAPDIGKNISCPNGSFDWDKHDLIEATISSLRLPEDVDVNVNIHSPVVPKGSSVGSSASVSVALTALLDFLSRSEVDPQWVARTCHEVETKVMGIECGVQDQAAAAFSLGVNYVDIYNYPNFTVNKVAITSSFQELLEESMLTLIYGGSHTSSDVHKMVITRLNKVGRLAPELAILRSIPDEARYCLQNGDLVGLGQAMRSNTSAQKALHPDLVSKECQKLIDFCQANSTLGEKVNGAGGPQGGSLTVLCKGDTKDKLAKQILQNFSSILVLEHKLAASGLKIGVL